MNGQLQKGVLELCVLSALEKKDYYGYELAQEITDQIPVSQGSIYPLLYQLKRQECFTTYFQESTKGTPCKYYQLTTKGKEYLSEMIKDWMLAKEYTKGIC